VKPFKGVLAVTKSDTAVLGAATSGIYVGVTGDLAVTMYDGTTAVFKAAPVGVLNISVTQVLSTGTTATNILALF
jgi:hypothetical protein